VERIFHNQNHILQFFWTRSKSFDCTKKSCIVIEDSTNGVKAAKAAGIFVWDTTVFIQKHKICLKQMSLSTILTNWTLILFDLDSKLSN
jgi:beta-phosphoglucomutase-like phosphatase (HAD superfamily)